MGQEHAAIPDSLERERSRSRSEAPEQEVALGDYWGELCRGMRIVEHFFSPERCHAVLRHSRDPTNRLTSAQAELLRKLALGHQQKTLALDLGISCAAVTQRAQRCIGRLGLVCRASLLPLFVVMSGIAHHGPPSAAVRARLSRRYVEGEVLDVVSFNRPDSTLPPHLSDAEQEVTRLLVEGRSQVEIAERRKTTLRTASNQIGAVFAKLGVSGRLALVYRLTGQQ
jgi:DNA-binding NarL/FixJ family response regulator